MSTGISYDAVAAEAICRQVVRANRKLFDAFHDLTDDDLLQVCMTEAWRAWSAFDSDRGLKLATFLGIRTKRRLIDLYRSKIAQARRDKVGCDQTVESQNLESAQNIGERLVDIAERAMTAAEQSMPQYSSPKSPRRYTLPQLASVLMLREHLRTSYRGIVLVLRQHDDVRERLGLQRVPEDNTLIYAHRTIRRVMARERTKQHERATYQSFEATDCDTDRSGPGSGTAHAQCSFGVGA